ncbi:Sodium-dependent glucose transporter 1 [Mizuhopecten yessoensis]|uniref:Sodium-dependent glucose transporter 1 n=1 Tax=Mizuhopecten yessoensis TaxID=6573 RepID=A0A210QG32_MIZYE|nr:Sodium-dependent glucose transporter 1 [Mizuhopecten yessoensis]
MHKASENDDSAEFRKEKFQSDSFISEIGVLEEKNEFILKTPPSDDTSLMTRLHLDSLYREKAILSLCLCWAFVTLGWAVSQFGPSFLDFQIITRTDVKKASGFLTSRSVGYLAGAVLSGNALLLSTWGQEGHSYVQALHFSFAFGGITSPLVTSAFLQETLEDWNDVNITDTGNVPSYKFTDCNSNVSQQTYSACTNSNTNQNVTAAPGYAIGDSRLYVAYILTAVMHISCAVPLFIMFLRARHCQRKKQKTKIDQDIKRISREMTFGFKILVLLSLCLFMAIYCAMEDTFTAYLTTFGVTQLNWSKVQGSYVTSLYWAVFGFARFLGIWVIKFISPAKIICVLTIVLCIDLGALSVFAGFNIDEGIWACAVCTGASMSLIYPCVIMWTEEKLLPVSGKIVSIFMIASSSGTMTNPIILGYLMETFTPMWFTYLLFGESVVLMILFLGLLLIARVSESRFGTGNSQNDVRVEIDLTSTKHV